MFFMAGKRLPAAGIVVAAIAAAVTFCLPAPRSAVMAPAVRLSSAAIAQVRAPQGPFATVTSALPQLQVQVTVGLAATAAALVILVVVGAAPPRRQRVPVRVSRPARRGRAPPSRGC
jgi:hypothetical protein